MQNRGYGAGYFTEKEAWEIPAPVARKLQQAFPSWKEMGESYLLGRKIWRPREETHAEAVFQLLLNPNDANSPWNAVPWDTSLLPFNVLEKIGDDPVFNQPMTLKLQQPREPKPTP